MDKLFLQVININITASYVILFVLILRLFLKKSPKIFSYALCLVVFLRLILPFTLQSPLSLIPNRAIELPKSITYEQTPKADNNAVKEKDNETTDNIANNSTVKTENEGLQTNISNLSNESSKFTLSWVEIGTSLWITGVFILLIYSIATSLKLSKIVKQAKFLYDNIYEIDTIKTPFVFGILNAKIYLPVNLGEAERPYIIQHEQTHIKRYDNVIKLLAFLIVSIHWFNPLVWLVFFLMSKDMELSCDEAVIKKMGSGIKKNYSNSLLSLSTGKKIIGGSPLAFGENNIKGRIKNILDYKKPSFWIVIAGIAVVIIAVVGLLSNPKEKKNGEQITVKKMTVEDYAKKHLDDEVKFYEKHYKIIDSKITKLEKIAVFDDILQTPVELWSIEYRIKPEDISKVMIAGGMEEIDGWITERGSMGIPLLVFTYENGVLEQIGTINSGDVDYLNYDLDNFASQEIAIRKMLELKGVLPRETYKGNHAVIKFKLSTGETSQILLSQPVIQGDKGIWTVERFMDGNGTIYYEYPKTDLKISEYYKALQKQFENGENSHLGDPAEVGYNFIKDMGQWTTKKSDLIIKNPASLEDFMETPISHYIGYITKMNIDGKFIDIDKVELLTSEDEARLKELSIDIDKLSTGYYIHNPNTWPYSLYLSDKTEYYLISNWDELSVTEYYPTKTDAAAYKSVSKKDLIEYIESSSQNRLFNIETKNGYITKIEEQYTP